MKIYSLGSLNIDYVYSVDHFVRAGETLSSENMAIFPGGKGLNQSVAVSRAGAEVIHGGCVGSGGDFLIDIMNESGVNTEKIKTVTTSSGHAIIQVDKTGQNCILLFSGANYQIDRSYIEGFLKDAQKGDILLMQNEISGLSDAFEIAKQLGMKIAFNPSPYHNDIKKLPLRFVDLWFCNEIEAGELFGGDTAEETIQNFISQYPESALVLTLGSKGSMYKDKYQQISQSAYKVKAIDTTAAGDTFTGYFLWAVSNNRDIKFALDIASRASSIAVSREGASKSIPFASEL
ncbi:MAG: ribokinase [Clostridia bacterium]|nr:ribokinase [Clostridia bacterium]